MKKDFVYSSLAVLVSVWLFIYLASWIVMPRLGKTYELNFDHGCDAGIFGFLDLQGSTCASGGPNIAGFPLSVHRGTLLNHILTITIDVVPAVILFVSSRYLYRRFRGTPTDP